jgi:molybdate transport system substrate-binding protein
MKKIILGLMILCSSIFADKITVFAASDLKFALDEIKERYTSVNKDVDINLIYGSSGKGMNQIENGAPFDIYFSANQNYVENLYKKGLLIEKPKLYALGRIVIWSKNKNFEKNKGFDNLKENWVSKIAIANPEHAPYGEKAKQALEKVGLYKEIEKKLVFGENISATTNMINIQAAQIGIIALSLALAPTIEEQNNYFLIDRSFHEPLFQAYSITKYAQNNKEAKDFYKFISSDESLKILKKYGFEVPNE